MKSEQRIQVTPRMVKTTITLPEQMWKDLAVKVIQEKGGRKKNDVIQELIQKYLDGK
jgi:metal-responsive CopG/Arc/MetJ family transcriptional regulator